MVGATQRLLAFFDNVLLPRFHQLSIGVPAEVRKAEADGTNSYLRPMPGAARMYPETDVRPFQPRADSVALPELLTHKATRIAKQYGIHQDQASQLSKEGLGTILEGWIVRYPSISPVTLATLLASKEREIKTRHGIEVNIVTLSPDFLPALNSGEITLASVEEILVSMSKGEPLDLKKYRSVPEAELSLVISQLIMDNPGASSGLLMGKVMRHFGGRADGKRVQEIIAQAGLRKAGPEQ